MKILAVALALTLAASAAPAVAQLPPDGRPVGDSVAGRGRNGATVSIYGLLYTGFGQVSDPGSESTWEFADAAVGAGAGFYVQGGLLSVGLDGSLTRTPYERRPAGAPVSAIVSGSATLTSLLASVRVSSGGLAIPGIPGVPGPRGGGRGGGDAGGLSTYVGGGLGALGYWLDDLEGANWDLSFAAGGGIEYGWSSGRAAFAEWKRFWVFHEREGVQSATVQHNRFELGARIPVLR